jgi:hypothetical protein
LNFYGNLFSLKEKHSQIAVLLHKQRARKAARGVLKKALVQLNIALVFVVCADRCTRRP